MKPVKLHVVRVSPCCRVVWLYLLQNEIPFELKDVDIFSRVSDGNSHIVLADEDHRRLPVLEDEDRCVVGVVACLRYLETKFTKSRKGWISDPQIKSRMYSILEWAAAELHSIIGYQLVYPQFLSGVEQTETNISAATRKVVDILESTEKKYFGHGSKFLCGEKLTVVDLYVATIVLQLEWVESVDMKLWPKLNKWLKEVRKQKHWDTVHAKHREFVESLKNVPLEST
ncbi:glutathione S-transferase theta-1-like [Dendronephthya gigantea]|uniref:glutathione S-transferase theta-1-like n=1 Tax=Dendronephthya gigantea TaxID=151771 RepID=UPI00106DA814|nr:glutathione S-transferase theta-1-like [Dendronephthya gigantea]